MPIDISTLIKGARQRRNLTQAELARLAGVSQQTIAKLESGITTRSRHLHEIAAALGMSVDELLRGTPSAVGQTSESPNPEDEGSILVYATRMGPEGQYVRMSDRIGLVATPEPLRLGGGLGVYLSESDMIPAYEPGDTVFAHLSLPPLPGTDCLFLGLPNENKEQRVAVRRLVRAYPKGWIALKWHPEPDEEKFELEDWPRVLRVMGKFVRR